MSIDTSQLDQLTTSEDVAASESAGSLIINGATTATYYDILTLFNTTEINDPGLQIALRTLLERVNRNHPHERLGELIIWAMEQAAPLAEVMTTLALTSQEALISPPLGDEAYLTSSHSYLYPTANLPEIRFATKLIIFYSQLIISLLEKSRMPDASSADIVSTLRFGMIFHALGNQFSNIRMYAEYLSRNGIKDYSDNPSRFMQAVESVVNNLRQAAESITNIANVPEEQLIPHQTVQTIIQRFRTANSEIDVVYIDNLLSDLPIYLQIPELDLDLIIRELLTNADKYGNGQVTITLEGNGLQPNSEPIRIRIASTGYTIRDGDLAEMQNLIVGIAPQIAMFKVKGGTGLLRLGRLSNHHNLSCTAERGIDGEGVTVSLLIPQGFLSES
jgi:signal transduction histidine kinase